MCSRRLEGLEGKEGGGLFSEAVCISMCGLWYAPRRLLSLFDRGRVCFTTAAWSLILLPLALASHHTTSAHTACLNFCLGYVPEDQPLSLLYH